MQRSARWLGFLISVTVTSVLSASAQAQVVGAKPITVIVPYATGIPKTAKSPNAAKLFLDWSMSDEGQIHSIKDHGNLTSLKTPPYNPPGFDPKVAKLWVPKFEEFESLRTTWIPEWNKTFGYRQ